MRVAMGVILYTDEEKKIAKKIFQKNKELYFLKELP